MRILNEFDLLYLDVKRYGFRLVEEDEGVKTYRKIIPSINSSIELEQYKNSFSLYQVDNETDNRFEIAVRYRVENQEQLDFLIYNGRVGCFFNAE